MRDVWLAACALSCALAAPAPLRADDWLAVLPACSEHAVSAPSLELVYPNGRLPALIAAGESLVARVRVPAALTPPPGVQQERALSGWSAELRGDGVVLSSAAISHRHNLAVVSVRPDAGSSLVYRVRLALPAYAAPGTYTLSLRTPFGDRKAERAVAVIGPGNLPRMAATPEAGLQGASLASLPVDVWVEDGAANEPTIPVQPRWVLGERALALRVGRELWVSEPCPSGRASFDAEVLDVMRSEQRTRVALPSSVAGLVPLRAAAIDASEFGAERTERSAGGFSVDNRDSHLARQWLLLVPANASVRAVNATLALFPASDLGVRDVSGIAVQLSVAAGVAARVELGPAAPAAALVIEPELVESGRDVTLRVRGAAQDARVAFDYGFARTALQGPSLQANFAGPLEQPLRALVLTPASGGRLVRGHLSVVPHRPPGCAVLGAPGAVDGPPSLLFALGFLLKRRGRSGFGNRVRPARRCPLRDRASHVQNPA